MSTGVFHAIGRGGAECGAAGCVDDHGSAGGGAAGPLPGLDLREQGCGGAQAPGQRDGSQPMDRPPAGVPRARSSICVLFESSVLSYFGYIPRGTYKALCRNSL